MTVHWIKYLRLIAKSTSTRGIHVYRYHYILFDSRTICTNGFEVVLQAGTGTSKIIFRHVFNAWWYAFASTCDRYSVNKVVIVFHIRLLLRYTVLEVCSPVIYLPGKQWTPAYRQRFRPTVIIADVGWLCIRSTSTAWWACVLPTVYCLPPPFSGWRNVKRNFIIY